MSRTDVRRAVDMANELRADLAVVTGDFITGAPTRCRCIEEIRNLRAPLGVFAATAITKFMPVRRRRERLFAKLA